MDVNPWLKATAGPVAGVTTFGVANAAATKYIVPSIKQANVIGNVESNRSITEIAKSDTKSVGYKAENKTVDVKLSKKKYPESAQHIEEAIKEGQPYILTLDRGDAPTRRKASLKGIDIVPGLDRDEYSPAMSKEGGAEASVKLINSSDNRGSGSIISSQLRKYPDGTKYQIIITNED